MWCLHTFYVLLTHLSLVSLFFQAQPHPVIIQESLLTRVWYKQDDKFLLPRAHVQFELFSPLAYLDPLNCNLTYMYAQILEDSLNEYAYAAELAGLRWSMKNTEYGLQVSQQ